MVCTDELVAAVDALCAVDPLVLGDGETLVALHRQLERLGAVTTRAVAAFDAGRSWEADGARTASAWLARHWDIGQESARRRVRLGRALRSMPAVEAAWLAGDIGQAQVRLLAAARTAETTECFARDEALLVEQARTLGYRLFVKALAYWAQLADALVAMARRGQGMPAGSRLPEPLFSVLVDYNTFGRTCELADGTVVAPGSLTRWLGEGWVERVVFDGPDRIKNVGVRRRIFSGATRRSIELRDRTCFHPTCDVPAEQCEIDHVRLWSEGGLTTEDNGRVACGFHNRERQKARPPPP